MNLSIQVRNAAYLKAKPGMNRQERQVYSLLRDRGPMHAWTISEYLTPSGSPLKITSYRRALHDLRKKCWVQELRKEFYLPTGASVTVYEASPEFNFDERGQADFFCVQATSSKSHIL